MAKKHLRQEAVLHHSEEKPFTLTDLLLADETFQDILKVPTQIEEYIPLNFVLHAGSEYEPPRPGKIKEADGKVTQLNSVETLTERFFDPNNPSVLAIQDVRSKNGIQQGQVSLIRATAPYARESYMIISKDAQHFNETGVSSAPPFYYAQNVLEEHYCAALALQSQLQKKYPDKLVLLMTNNMQEVVGVTPPTHHRPDQMSKTKKQTEQALLGRSVGTTKTIALPHTHVVVFDSADAVPPDFRLGINREYARENQAKVLENTRRVIDSKEHAFEKRVIRTLVTKYAGKLGEEMRSRLPAEALDHLIEVNSMRLEKEMRSRFPQQGLSEANLAELEKEMKDYLSQQALTGINSVLKPEQSDRPAGYRFIAGHIDEAWRIPAVLKAHYFAYKTIVAETTSIEVALLDSEGMVSAETVALAPKGPQRNLARLHHRKTRRLVPQPSFKEYTEILPDGTVVAHISPLLLEKIGPMESLGVILCRMAEYEPKDAVLVAQENAFAAEVVQDLGFTTHLPFAEIA